jgi:hypothetical protein
VDLGYDVWLANTPGSNRYSKHEFLLRDEPAYWRYNWASNAFDLSGLLMHIKRVTESDDDVVIMAFGSASLQVLYRYAENSHLLA